MPHAEDKQPSLESLVENLHIDLDFLHPGGSDITRELAQLCEIGKDVSVLDVASGTGESACYLTEKLGARVVGIDRSDGMIEKAKHKAAQRNLGTYFRKADAHRLPFDDAAFDRAISECSVSLLDKERAISEMARVVKPSGYVGIHDLFWKQGTPERLKRWLVENEGEQPETLQGWKAVFEKAGLVDVMAVDRSFLIPTWMKEIRKKLGFAEQLMIYFRIARRWGIQGIMKILESERILQSKYTGYCIIVGRKPAS